MCLAIPLQVLSVDGDRARVASGGMELEVGLELVDEVSVGDYVIVHAGYAIQQLTAAEAEETLTILQRWADSVPEEP